MMLSRASVLATLYALWCLEGASSFVAHHSPRQQRRPTFIESSRSNDNNIAISRRDLLPSSFSSAAAAAAIGYQLLSITGVANAAETEEETWMAPTSPAFQKARSQLIKEANQAVEKVTPEIRNEYARDGVTVVRNAVSQKWIQALRDGCEDAQDNAGPFGEYLQKPTDEGIFFTDLEIARRLPVFSAFSQYGPCAAIAGAVMGSSSVRYLYDQLFIKEQGVSTRTPWHQDGGYWRIKGQQVGSVFVPLDSVKMGDGLDFVAGSHLDWKLHNPQHFADGTQYTGTSLPPMPDIDEMVKEGTVQLKTMSLEPGDVLVFSSRTVHGGPGNWGRALSTRWSGDEATFWDRPGEGAVPTGDVGLVDGELLAHNGAAFPEVWNSMA